MDIVERLREKAERKSPNLYRKQQRIETEAADEIERLREAHETVSKIVDGMTLHFVERGKEIERLRNALRWALPYVKTDEKVNDIVCAALKEGE